MCWDGGSECLNESPSEKEGKSVLKNASTVVRMASMKALPKRKGNGEPFSVRIDSIFCLNESPSEKEGKWISPGTQFQSPSSLNESPSEKEGKL